MADERENILKLTLKYDDALEGIQKYRNEIIELQEKEEALREEEEKGTITHEEMLKELEALNVAEKQRRENIRILQKEIQNNMRMEQEQEGSLRALRAELSNATKEYDALNRSEREGAKGEELREHINAITNELKEAEAATQRFYRNVGNYEQSVANALGANSKWMNNLQQLAGLFNGGLKSGLQTASAGVASFGKQLLALMANPIVAVIAAIAAAFMALKEGIASSEENTNKLNAVMAPFKGVLEAVLNVLQSMVGVVLDVVQGFESLALAGAKWAESLPLIGSAIANVNKAMEEQATAARLNAEIAKAEREQIISSAETENKVMKLRTDAANKSKYTTAERRAMLQQAIALEEQEAKKAVQIAKMKLAALQAEAAASQNDAEMMRRLAEATAAVTRANTEYYQSTLRMRAQIANFDNQEAAEAKQRAAAAKAAAKQRADEAKRRAEEAKRAAEEAAKAERDAIRAAEDILISLIADNFDQRRAKINLQYDRQIEDLRARLEKEKNLTAAAREAINAQIINLEIVRGQELNKIYEEQDKAFLTAEQKKYTDAEALQKLRDSNALAMLRVQGADELAVLQETARQKEQYFENLHQMIGESEDAFRARQLAAQEAYYAAQDALDKKRIEQEKKTADARVKIKKAAADAEKMLLQGITAALDALGEENRAAVQLSKVLSLAQIAIDSGVAIAEGTKAAAGVPFPANLAAIASTVGTVLANIATAIQTVKGAKFAQGGAVYGAGDSKSDSIPARLSNGESVINANSTTLFSPLLSALNQLGGGAPIIVEGGGEIMGEEMLAAAVAKGMAIAPRQVLAVEQLDDTQKRVDTLERMSTI